MTAVGTSLMASSHKGLHERYLSPFNDSNSPSLSESRAVKCHAAKCPLWDPKSFGEGYWLLALYGQAVPEQEDRFKFLRSFSRPY